MDKRVKLGKTTWAKAPGQKTVRPKQEGMGSKNVLTQKKKKKGGENDIDEQRLDVSTGLGLPIYKLDFTKRWAILFF